MSHRYGRAEHAGTRRWVRAEGDEWAVLDDAPWAGGQPTGARVPESALRAPVAPSKIVCVGRNYAAHAAELGNEVPPSPLLFLKPPSSLIGPGEAIRLPAASERVEHEAELGLVIGRRLTEGDEAAAKEAIFGLTCVNDVTARDLQRADVQFTRAKGFDSFCPVGPWITTGLDPLDLEVRCDVDGDERQRGRTSLMVFGPHALVAFISGIMTLEPGDLVATGTPAGVGPLTAGDEVTVSIEHVGQLRNPVTRR